jgi:hypothetical protein
VGQRSGTTRAGLALVASLAIGHPAAAGLFAKHAISVSGVYGGPRPMTVTAPDGHTRAIARFSDWAPGEESKDSLSVFIGGDDHDFPGGPNAELLWSPDSRALAVTADGGGAIGSFETTLLVRKPKGRHWREISLTRAVTRLFQPRMRCDGEEQPNIGAVGWTSEKRLIVAAQVPPDSSCSNMGMTAAYIVDVQTGDVLMDIDQRALQQRYRRMLGTAFSAGAGRKHHRHKMR